MPDEDKTFSGSFVLDLRIWWCKVHTLYNKIFIHVSSCRLPNVVKAKKKNLCHFPARVKKALERKKPGHKGFKNIWSELGWCVSWLMTKVPALSRKVACTVKGGHLPFSKHSSLALPLLKVVTVTSQINRLLIRLLYMYVVYQGTLSLPIAFLSYGLLIIKKMIWKYFRRPLSKHTFSNPYQKKLTNH